MNNDIFECLPESDDCFFVPLGYDKNVNYIKNIIIKSDNEFFLWEDGKDLTKLVQSGIIN